MGLTLHHPNVVRVNHLVNKVDEVGAIRRYLIMEYVDGIKIENIKFRSESERLLLLREMLESMRYMLGCGVLPRDLHLGNMMRTFDGHWKWIDIGHYLFKIDEEHRRSVLCTHKALMRIIEHLLEGSSEEDGPLGRALWSANSGFLPIAHDLEPAEAINAFRAHVDTLLAIVLERDSDHQWDIDKSKQNT
jgi:serine/threonine protein kinase